MVWHPVMKCTYLEQSLASSQRASLCRCAESCQLLTAQSLGFACKTSLTSDAQQLDRASIQSSLDGAHLPPLL